MKAEEKKILYNLIKTSSQYINGYTPEFFKGEEPVFTDDVAEEQKVISDIQTAEKKGISIEEIASKISRCTRCGLARTRTNVVPGMGVKNPYVMVIGEGPGAEEDAQGKPFVGKAGILLDRMLAAIQLERNTIL